MAETLPNIDLPAGQWVDLYTESGIAVGTQIVVTNLGSTRINLSTKPTEPTNSDGWETLSVNGQMNNEAGSTGEWARSEGNQGRINVKILGA